MNAVPASPGGDETEWVLRASPGIGTIGLSRLLAELTTEREYSVTVPSPSYVAATEYQHQG